MFLLIAAASMLPLVPYLPLCCAMQMVFERVTRVWRDQIQPSLSAGNTVLVVGHRCSLGAIIAQVESRSALVELPTQRMPPVGIPLVYSVSPTGQARPMFQQSKMSESPEVQVIATTRIAPSFSFSFPYSCSFAKINSEHNDYEWARADFFSEITDRCAGRSKTAR